MQAAWMILSGLNRTVWLMTKRRGYLIEQIADMDNLRKADLEAQSGKVRKNRYIRRHNEHAEEDLQELRRMILELDFPPVEYSMMKVHNDSGKTREIARQNYYPWRILHHAIIRVIGKDIYRNLIYDTFACIPGKGLHFGVKRLKMFLRRYPEYTWYWKTDYKKYYQSIPHDLVVKRLRHHFKDERFIQLMEMTILSYDSGPEISEALKQEYEKREKRNNHRRVHKPASGRIRGQSYSSSHEGASALQVSADVL